MAAPPATPVPTISPAEIQLLVSRTGLVLNPGQVADLVLAWRQVAGIIAVMQRDRPLADDMAVTFRLPSPEPLAAPAPVRKKVPVVATAPSKGAATPKAPARRDAKPEAPSRRDAKPKAPSRRDLKR